MKQLLHHFRNEHDNDDSSSYFVVGLHDRAFVGLLLIKDDDNDIVTCRYVVELQKPITAAEAEAVAAASEPETTNEAGKKAANNNLHGDIANGDDDDDDGNDDDVNNYNDKEQEQQASTRTNRKQDMLLVDPWQIQAVVGTIDYFPQQQQQQPSSSSTADAASRGGPSPLPSHLAIIVAVTYYNKTLAIYRIDLSELLDDQQMAADAPVTTTDARVVPVMAPITVHHSSKRVGSLCFARVPPPTSSPLSQGHQQQQQQQQHDMVVVITGDLAGDAFAYSLTHSQDPDPVGDDEASSKGDADAVRVDKRPKLKVALKESPEEVTCCSYRRLLLGHTASMLTAVECTTSSSNGNGGSLLLTADRDEKIRVSSFPNVHEIQGYLLGHSAFVSSMAIVKDSNIDNSQDKKNKNAAMNIVVSCGGDSFLRVWDYQKCLELVSLDLSSLNNKLQVSGIPTKVATAVVTKDCNDDTLLLHVVVIYDESKNMHVFQVTLPVGSTRSNSDGNDTTTIATISTTAAAIREAVQISLPAQPLAISMSSPNQVLVLMRDPAYLQVYHIPFATDTNTLNTTGSQPACRLLQNVLTQAAPRLQLPDTVLEKDRFGNYKMQKNTEIRGPAHEMPWNNARRRDTAREQTRRARKNRNSRKRQKTSNSKEKDKNNKHDTSATRSSNIDGLAS